MRTARRGHAAQHFSLLIYYVELFNIIYTNENAHISGLCDINKINLAK